MEKAIVKKTEIPTLGGKKVEGQFESSVSATLAQLGALTVPVVTYNLKYSGGSDAFSKITPHLYLLELAFTILAVVFVLVGHLFVACTMVVALFACLGLNSIYWFFTRNKPQISAQFISPVQFQKGDKKHMLPINEKYVNKQPIILQESRTKAKQKKVKTPVQP